MEIPFLDGSVPSPLFLQISMFIPHVKAASVDVYHPEAVAIDSFGKGVSSHGVKVRNTGEMRCANLTDLSTYKKSVSEQCLIRLKCNRLLETTFFRYAVCLQSSHGYMEGYRVWVRVCLPSLPDTLKGRRKMAPLLPDSSFPWPIYYCTL